MYILDKFRLNRSKTRDFVTILNYVRFQDLKNSDFSPITVKFSSEILKHGSSK